MLAKMKPLRDMRYASEICDAAKAAVCEVFGLAIETMTSRRKPARIAWPRQIAMAIAHEQSQLTLQLIGIAFNRDDGTVLHAIKTVKNYLSIHDAVAVRDWSNCVEAYERRVRWNNNPNFVASTG